MIFIFLDRIVLVEKDFFFRFSLFLKEVEDLNLGSVEAVEDLGSIEVVEDLSLVEVVEGLNSIRAVGALPLEASLEASLEALVLDLIDLL